MSTDTLYDYLLYLVRIDPLGARESAYKALEDEIETTPESGIGGLWKIISLSYYYLDEFRPSNSYHDSSLVYFEKAADTPGIISVYLNKGNNYFNLRSLDTSLMLYEKALDMSIEAENSRLFSLSLVSIGNYYNEVGNYKEAEKYYLRFLNKKQQEDNQPGIALAYQNLGYNFQSQSINYRALENYFKSLEIYEQIKDPRGIIDVSNSIGIVFTENQEFEKAEGYYKKALALSSDIGDKAREAEILGNIGILYLEKGNLDTALVKLEQTLQTLNSFDLAEMQDLTPYYFRLGDIYKKKGEMEKAFESYTQSLELSRKIEDKRSIASSLIELGKLGNETKRFALAKNNCQDALRFLEDIDSPLELLVDSYDCLANAYEGLGSINRSQQYLKKYVSLHDSLDKVKNAKEVTRLGIQYQYEKEFLADSLEREKELLENELAYQAEISRERNTKRMFLFGSIIVFIGAVALLNRLIYTRKSRKIIRKEKEKSDNLLLNILPSEVADELKEKGHAEARQFDRATILFSDFTEFTRLSEQMSPKELVDEIHYCYKIFDEIVTKHKVEKIKTIGDAYMAAGGLSKDPKGSAYQVILAALEMQEFLGRRKEERKRQNMPGFSMRLGIHSGPVVAGIVGIKKFQYDIWGDTVNTAYRLQETGSNGKVNISRATYELVKEKANLTFEHRGKISSKNKAEQDMYFVDKIRQPVN